MDYSELVQEIVSRVSMYLKKDCCDRKKLIILCHEHGTDCHKLLDSPRLAEHFKTECALLNDYGCDVEACEGLVLFNLTNADIARIASCVCDTPYTEMVAKALLLGKPVWVPKQEIELFKYDSATEYGKMMYEKLRLLEKLGVILCSCDDLEDMVLGGVRCSGSLCTESAPAPCCEAAPVEKCCGDYICSKKVITEKDMINAHTGGAVRVLAGEKTIVTDLAREYARTYAIQIIKS